MRAEREGPVAPTLVLRTSCLRQGCEDINNYRRLNRIHEG